MQVICSGISLVAAIISLAFSSSLSHSLSHYISHSDKLANVLSCPFISLLLTNLALFLIY
ncbi:hypothetical protein BKA57DRAFT_460249 [Linnemannia elongata]|nr:hypothetical protein BKA57DRAFT_460249 [Linnemannia elongata]